jgi:hypothetical protein
VTPLGKVEGKLNTFILFREKILRVRKAWWKGNRFRGVALNKMAKTLKWILIKKSASLGIH